MNHLSQLPTPLARPAHQTLVVLEGPHDVRFLRTVSSILHIEADLPDLSRWERHGEIVFLTTGGTGSPDLAQQLVRLGCAQFHLLDRESPAESSRRQQTVQAINALPGCVAKLTSKRSLENYLHPQAIIEARGISVQFGDQDDVAALVAQAVLKLRQPELDWQELSHRCRKRLRNRAKKWLNTEAAARLTRQLLHEQDPDDEVEDWLSTIAELHHAHGMAGMRPF